MQPVTPQLTYAGFMLALIFTVSISSVLWWMFKLPRQITHLVARVHHAVDAVKTILVPTLGENYSLRGVELACRLGAEQNAVIKLINVIEVPYSLPLGAQMPRTIEKQALEVLEEARQIVEARSQTCEIRMERARIAGEKIAEVVHQEDIEMVVMGIRSRYAALENIVGKTTELLLRKLPCEIVIDIMPAQEHLK